MLAYEFGISEEEPLVELDPALSDPHHRGRTVVRLTFHSGRTIIYKPKPIDVEHAFNEFVSQHGGATGFSPIKVLNRNGYGWAQDATARLELGPVPDYGLGQATAWLWLLNATDMHSENLALSREGVIGLDLETLFSVNPSDTRESFCDTWRDFSITSTLLYDAALPGSVSEIGYSGFTPKDFVRTPYANVTFSVESGHIRMEKHSARKTPKEDGKSSIPVKQDAEEIMRGFASAVSSLVPLATDFAKGLPEQTPLRVILRPTNFYYQLLHRIHQPRFLRSASLTSLELHRLFHSVPLFGRQTLDRDVDSIVLDEISQIQAQDIPYFSRSAGSCQIKTTKNTVKNYSGLSGKEKVIAKLEAIRHADFDEQCDLLATALGRPSLGTIQRMPHLLDIEGTTETTCPASLQANLSLLVKHLIDSSFESDSGMPRWTCVSGSVDAISLRAYAGDLSFFSGSLGILLALQAAAITLESKASAEADEFLRRNNAAVVSRLRRFVQNKEHEGLSLGFTGLGGKLFSLSVLYHLNPEVWKDAPSIVEGLIGSSDIRVADDRWLDVVAGSAGLIMGCEQVLRYLPPHLARPATRLMLSAKDHFLRSAKTFDGYKAWTIPDERLPLVGYAHGWAGIVSALMIASIRAGSENERAGILSMVQQTVNFPLSSVTDDGTWLDYRGSLDTDAEFPKVNRSWCNGTIGILKGLSNLEDLLPRELAKVFTQFEFNLSSVSDREVTRYCCGQIAELDLAISEPFNVKHDDVLRLAEHIVSKSVEPVSDHLARDIPERFYASLFQGKAGILYSALRVFNPALPSLSGPCKPTKSRLGDPMQKV